MPKLTFYNLPEQKRKKLIEAAEKEFSRVPLFEASIANIIKMADIPRGSFYQYFDDKEDLYSYLLENQLEKIKIYFVRLLKEHQGDLVEALMDMHFYFLNRLSDGEGRNFLRSAMLHTSYTVENSFRSMFEPYPDNEKMKEFKGLINTENLNITEESELLYIFKIITALSFNNLIEKTIKGLTTDEAMESFKKGISLLKRGIYKSKEV